MSKPAVSLPCLMACLLALLPPLPVSAQASESAQTEQLESEPEIVVSAKSTVTAKEFRQRTETFVKELGEAGPINQVSRWGQPPCPRAKGLSPKFDRFVEATVQRVAMEAGAPIGDCGEGATNILIVFTTQPDAFMRDVRKNHAGLLGYHFIGQRKALVEFRAPMKSWHVTMTEIPGAYQAIDYAYGPSPPAGTGSRIRPQYKSRFAFALVVVDSNAIEGEEIGPVAERIAMQALTSSAELDACSGFPSVMDFLNAKCGRTDGDGGLTEFDRAYLAALYDFQRDELKGFMRDTIAKRIMAELGPIAESE